MNEFHISYGHTEWNFLSSCSENYDEIWKQSIVKLNFIPINLFHQGVEVELWGQSG